MTDEEDRGTVTVKVELSEPLVELIKQVKEEDAPLFREGKKSLAQWVEEAALLRLRMAEGKHEVPVTAEVPEEAVERAKLHAEDRRIRTGEDTDIGEWIHEFIDLQFRFPDEDNDEE